MKRLTVFVLALLTLGASAFAPQTTEAVDSAAIAKIRDEGLNRSQVMDTVFWLTDRYGPRLNGSPEFEEAGEWAVTRLESWGARNVRKERFSSGRGWSLVGFHANMTSPRVMPIIGMPKAWTPGIGRTAVVADVVRPQIVTEADAQKYRGQLRGKIVLTQPARAVRMLEHGDGTVARYDDHGGRWRTEAMTPQVPATPRPVAGGAPDAAGTGRGRARGGAAPFNVDDFYKSEGVLALFDRGSGNDVVRGGSNLSWEHQRLDGGTLFVMDGASPYDDPTSVLPQVTLAVEHYNRMVRLLDRQIPVKVELRIETRFTEESPNRLNSFNIVGEIPGTDKADEFVVIGAHFDSWHGATGATDNAVGVAEMMEVVRILNATGLRPRRTIRIGLWGNEESNLDGSRAYVRRHLGTSTAPSPEFAKTTAYFNLDNGTGPIRGVWTQGNAPARAVFQAWAAPLRDLGVDLLSPRSVVSTDHISFHEMGVPAFQFVQERLEYTARTHHSTMDFYDRVQPEHVKQAATVAAVFAWLAANRETPLPRLAAAAP